MLEVTILKVIHNGINEAKKLMPHIQNCHVFAPEAAISTEVDSRKIELLWQKLLKKSREYVQVFQRYKHNQVGLRDKGEYFCTRDDLLYLSKRALWLTERFSNEEARKRWDQLQEIEGAMNNTHTAFARKDLKLFNRSRITALEGLLKFTRARDQEIARNIEDSEGRIREAYPWLEDETIKWCIEIGGSHKPERYTEVKANVITLGDISSMPPFTRKLISLYGREDIIDVPEVERLRLSLLLFAGRRDFVYTEDQINVADYEELVKMFTK